MSHTDAAAFLEQNDDAAQTLTVADVEPYATHHAGGLFVLGSWVGKRYVKMHDDWGPADDGPVIVHSYDPDADYDDPSEFVEGFTTGREAYDRFLQLIGESDAS